MSLQKYNFPIYAVFPCPAVEIVLMLTSKPPKSPCIVSGEDASLVKMRSLSDLGTSLLPFLVNSSQRAP